MLCLCWPLQSLAVDGIEYDYSESTTHLNLRLSNVHLDEALVALSNELGFRLYTQEIDLHREVTAEINGPAATVFIKLIKPDSVVMSLSDNPAGKITSLTVLPVGEKSDQLTQAGGRPALSPPLTGDAEEDRRKIELYERRLLRRSQGMGRKNE